MTIRTRTDLAIDLSTGGSNTNRIETKFIVDLLDSITIASEAVSFNAERLLYFITTADMNVTTDQAFTKVGTFTTWMPTVIRAVNASTSLTTAAGGIYDTAAKGGTPLVAAAQAYAALTGATLGLDLTLAAYGKGVRTNPPILALSTPQGGAATAGFYVFGVPLT